MWDFSILLSIKLLLRTIPFLFLRAAVSLIFTAILILAIWTGISLVKYLGDISVLPKTSLWMILGGLLGLGIAVWVIRWLKSWALYLVKAAHIAVLVELDQGRPLSGGRGQISYGQSIVKERFGEASALFLLDELVKSVLQAIDRLSLGILDFLPKKSSAQIATALRTFLYFAFGYLDEIVLAHAINNRSDDPWGSARDALVLYGQNWKTILKNALWLTVFVLAFVALVLSVMVWPAWTEYQTAPAPGTLRAVVIGIMGAAAVSAVLVGPFALICLIQVWFRTISGERVSPAWSATISQIAPQFNQFRGPRMSASRVGNTTRNGDLI